MSSRRDADSPDATGSVPEADACAAGATRSSSLRRIIRYGVWGATGGAILALVQYVGPELLGRPTLRWVFLYALLGGVLAGGWDGTTRWLSVQLDLDRQTHALLAGLLAGLLLFGATLLVTAVTHPTGGGEASLSSGFFVVWLYKEGGAFGAGLLAGTLWRYLDP